MFLHRPSDHLVLTSDSSAVVDFHVSYEDTDATRQIYVTTPSRRSGTLNGAGTILVTGVGNAALGAQGSQVPPNVTRRVRGMTIRNRLSNTASGNVFLKYSEDIGVTYIEEFGAFLQPGNHARFDENNGWTVFTNPGRTPNLLSLLGNLVVELRIANDIAIANGGPAYTDDPSVRRLDPAYQPS